MSVRWRTRSESQHFSRNIAFEIFFFGEIPKTRDKLQRSIYNFWFRSDCMKTGGWFCFRRTESVLNRIAEIHIRGDSHKDDTHKLAPQGLLSTIS